MGWDLLNSKASRFGSQTARRHRRDTTSPRLTSTADGPRRGCLDLPETRRQQAGIAAVRQQTGIAIINDMPGMMHFAIVKRDACRAPVVRADALHPRQRSNCPPFSCTTSARALANSCQLTRRIEPAVDVIATGASSPTVSEAASLVGYSPVCSANASAFIGHEGIEHPGKTGIASIRRIPGGVPPIARVRRRFAHAGERRRHRPKSLSR